MRIKTNLSPAKLEIIGKSMASAAKKQQKPYKPENNAEQELLRRHDLVLATMAESLQSEISDLLLGD